MMWKNLNNHLWCKSANLWNSHLWKRFKFMESSIEIWNYVWTMALCNAEENMLYVTYVLFKATFKVKNLLVFLNTKNWAHIDLRFYMILSLLVLQSHNWHTIDFLFSSEGSMLASLEWLSFRCVLFLLRTCFSSAWSLSFWTWTNIVQ